MRCALIWTCLGCGDSYSYEGIHPRPFARGWRDRSRERARRMWADAPTKAEADRTAQAMVDEYLPARPLTEGEASDA